MKNTLILLAVFWAVSAEYTMQQSGESFAFVDFEHFYNTNAECLAHLPAATRMLDIIMFSGDQAMAMKTAYCHKFEF